VTVPVSVPQMQAAVEAGLRRVVPDLPPEGLYAPARYALEGGGKRVRPLLVLLAARTLGATDEDALPAALAVEVFHTFTLVHDDVMDHAHTRRGRASVHAAWDEPTAMLAGDLLMGESYRLLAASPRGDLRAMLACWGEMVRRLCEGQALDKAFETDPAVSVDRYLDMIDRKTGALLACALELGGLVADGSDDDRAALRAAGHAAGRAFQIQDDLLDLTADDAAWGKPVGGDLVEGKRAFLLLRALERAEGDDAAFFHAVADRPGLDAARVPEARARMDRLGVLDDARAAVQAWTDRALAALRRLPENDARAALEHLVEGLSGRSR
jgi:geranylgeranyl diphosphate synthase, type II